MTPLSGCRRVLALLAALTLASEALAQEACPASVDFDIRDFIDQTIGFPESHDDTLPAGTSLETVCHDRFCLGHNSARKQPDWVIERMNPSIVCGDNTRPDGWKAEAKLSDPGHGATDEHYKHSKYARGHNAASADFKSDRALMKQTFVFSNAVPQKQDGFNGSYWRFLEENVQHLALSGADLLVITGPVPADPDGRPISVKASANRCGIALELAGRARLKKLEICDANDDDPGIPCPEGSAVAVPAGMFKIIHVLGRDRTFAFLMSNEDHRDLNSRGLDNDAYLEEWRASLDLIEALTHLRFFPRADKRQNDMLRQSCTETRWRL